MIVTKVKKQHPGYGVFSHYIETDDEVKFISYKQWLTYQYGSITDSHIKNIYYTSDKSWGISYCYNNNRLYFKNENLITHMLLAQ